MECYGEEEPIFQGLFLVMVIKTVNLKDFAKEIGVYHEQRIEDLKNATAKGIINIFPEIIRNSPIDTGLYAQSWDFTIEEKSVLLGNFAPHAAIIEFGARPFKPPLGPLLAWAKRVTGDPSQPPEYSSHVWALAKYTQNKIMEKGMEPRHVLANLIPSIIESIKDEMRRLK